MCLLTVNVKAPDITLKTRHKLLLLYSEINIISKIIKKKKAPGTQKEFGLIWFWGCICFVIFAFEWP